MTTYGTMQTRIADEIIRDDLTSQIQNAIKTAIKYYERERFWFNENRAYTTTVADQQYYQLPSDFVGIDTLTITINSNIYPLTQRSWEYIEQINIGTSNSSGYPEDFAIYQGQFRLYPVPNTAGWTLTLSYIQQFTTPSSASDTSPWFVEAEPLIRARAKFELFTHVIYEFELAKTMAMVEARELESLQRLTSKQRATRTLRPTTF